MTVIDFQEEVLRRAERPPRLEVDDLLSRASQDLGLDKDKAGYLVLIEGIDFD